MVQQGSEIGTYIEELGEKALLITVFDSSSALGKVKLFTKKTVEAVREALADSTDVPPELAFDDAWKGSTDSLLDGIFGKDA